MMDQATKAAAFKLAFEIQAATKSAKTRTGDQYLGTRVRADMTTLRKKILSYLSAYQEPDHIDSTTEVGDYVLIVGHLWHGRLGTVVKKMPATVEILVVDRSKIRARLRDHYVSTRGAFYGCSVYKDTAATHAYLQQRQDKWEEQQICEYLYKNTGLHTSGVDQARRIYQFMVNECLRTIY